MRANYSSNKKQESEEYPSQTVNVTQMFGKEQILKTQPLTGFHSLFIRQ